MNTVVCDWCERDVDIDDTEHIAWCRSHCRICGASLEGRRRNAVTCSAECSRRNRHEGVKRWKTRNRARMRASEQRWRDRCREHVRARQRRWAQENREKCTASSRRWRRRHLEKSREYQRQYRARVRARLLASSDNLPSEET